MGLIILSCVNHSLYSMFGLLIRIKEYNFLVADEFDPLTIKTLVLFIFW